MSQPYVGEIRMFGGNFAPAGWAFCNGAVLPIAENDVLFQLIGTTYGGDGQTTFQLPNLASRIPIHAGTGAGSTVVLGQVGGVETVTLTTNQIPAHTHPMIGSTDLATTASPTNAVLATLPAAGTQSAYGNKTPVGAIDPSSIGSQGTSQPHDNIQPILAVNFIISLFGVFPSQS